MTCHDGCGAHGYASLYIPREEPKVTLYFCTACGPVYEKHREAGATWREARSAVKRQ